MHPIQMQEGNRGIGMGYTAFIRRFEAICAEGGVAALSALGRLIAPVGAPGKGGRIPAQTQGDCLDVEYSIAGLKFLVDLFGMNSGFITY